MPHPKHLMPRGTPREIDAFAAKVRALGSREASALLEHAGAEPLFLATHGMRRWYTYNCWNNAKKILAVRAALARGMDLRAPVGAFRGFHVAADDALARTEPGALLRLPVTRNGGCSSWTLDRARADCFSGARTGVVGLVVRLEQSTNVRAFLAPPSRSSPWFERVYEATQGRSFRYKEEEYAVQGSPLTVRVVAVKRTSGVRSVSTEGTILPGPLAELRALSAALASAQSAARALR